MGTVSKVVFQSKIETSDPSAKLGLKIVLNNETLYSNDHITEPVLFEHKIDDADGEHELQFILSGKLPEHTKVDADGNILGDARLTISNINFDEIDIMQVFTEQAVYSHDFNGTKAEIQEKFYGEIGCNGILSLKFTTPFYLWLLSNM